MGALASGDILLSGHPCNLHVNSSVQSATNQMTIQYKANHDYDTERLVFTYKHGMKQILNDYENCDNEKKGSTKRDQHMSGLPIKLMIYSV